MQQDDPIFASLKQLAAEVPVQVDITSRVLQTIRTTPPPEDRSPMVVGATVACLIAIACGIYAAKSCLSATDPMSALVSPVQTEIQW